MPMPDHPDPDADIGRQALQEFTGQHPVVSAPLNPEQQRIFRKGVPEKHPTLQIFHRTAEVCIAVYNKLIDLFAMEPPEH